MAGWVEGVTCKMLRVFKCQKNSSGRLIAKMDNLGYLSANSLNYFNVSLNMSYWNLLLLVGMYFWIACENYAPKEKKQPLIWLSPYDTRKIGS